MRERSPSLTLTATTTVSPGEKSGTCRLAAIFSACSRSSSWMMFILVTFERVAGCVPAIRLKINHARNGYRLIAVLRRPQAPQIGPALAGRPFRLEALPEGDRLVIARQQHLGNGR